MGTWLHRHHIRLRDLRADVLEKSSSPFCPTTGESPSCFVALSPIGAPPLEALLQSVSVTFSDGTVVAIRKCSPSGLTAFIKKYVFTGKEVELCSH